MSNVYLPWPKRVSLDGETVAIRNEHTPHAPWSASNGSRLTDAQVKDWIGIAPYSLTPELRIVQKGNYEWRLLLGGKLICGGSTPDVVLAEASRLAAEFAASGAATTPVFTFEQEG